MSRLPDMLDTLVELLDRECMAFTSSLFALSVQWHGNCTDAHQLNFEFCELSSSWSTEWIE